MKNVGLTDKEIDEIVAANGLTVVEELPVIVKKKYRFEDYGVSSDYTPKTTRKDIEDFIQENPDIEEEFGDRLEDEEDVFEPLTFEEVADIVDNIKYGCFSSEVLIEIGNLIGRKNFYIV